MIEIQAQLELTDQGREINTYLKQRLKEVAAQAPEDANVYAALHRLQGEFVVDVDVLGIAWRGASTYREQNAYLAIDFAVGEMLEKIRTYKDTRKF